MMQHRKDKRSKEYGLPEQLCSDSDQGIFFVSVFRSGSRSHQEQKDCLKNIQLKNTVKCNFLVLLRLDTVHNRFKNFLNDF